MKVVPFQFFENSLKITEHGVYMVQNNADSS